MATRKRTTGTLQDVTVEILKGIRDELRSLRVDTNARFESLERRFESIEGKLVSLEQTTTRGFGTVTARLENLRDIAGDRYRDLDARVRALETRSK